MDFHRLFKRKEEVATHPMAGENQKETLSNRVVSLSEGDLLDGQAPANLLWNSVGGAISIRADKILGILEGRTRIKAAVLQEVCPALFAKDPHPGTEFFIPLQVVVTQLEDVFSNMSGGETYQENFDTPFGQLAREDEARFEEKPERVHSAPARPIILDAQVNGSQAAGPEPRWVTGLNGSAAERPTQSPDGTERVLETEASTVPIDPATGEDPASAPEPKLSLPAHHSDSKLHGSEPGKDSVSPEDPENRGPRTEPPQSKSEPPRYHRSPFGAVSPESPPRLRQPQSDDIRREGHQALQEIFLTDEQLDGSKVADLVLQLPRVTGVVIMLSDGAVLGGGLSGGITESLLGLAPRFVQDLARFTESMHGGPTRFVTLAGSGCLLSLTIGGQVLVLVGHEGKNLPPGLRDRLLATAHALNMIYGLQP